MKTGLIFHICLCFSSRKKKCKNNNNMKFSLGENDSFEFKMNIKFAMNKIFKLLFISLCFPVDYFDGSSARYFSMLCFVAHYLAPKSSASNV